MKAYSSKAKNQGLHYQLRSKVPEENKTEFQFPQQKLLFQLSVTILVELA